VSDHRQRLCANTRLRRAEDRRLRPTGVLKQIIRAQPLTEESRVIVLAGMWQYHAPSEEFWSALRHSSQQ
jgi:hypothetical protein